jgi:hypothetical protein
MRESEQRFRDYAETASDWLWETGPDHRFNRVTERHLALGINPAGRVAATRWDLATDVEDREQSAAGVSAVFRSDAATRLSTASDPPAPHAPRG